VDQVLQPLGFVRRKGTWNRKADRFVDVIDLQVSKAGDAVTINAGVLEPIVHTRFWGTAPPLFVQEPSATVRARIGQLRNGKDQWWPVNEKKTIAEVPEVVKAFALPFLEQMHGHAAMEEFLSQEIAMRPHPPETIYLAILKGVRGDTAGACAALRSLHQTAAGAWKDRITEVAERLGCG